LGSRVWSSGLTVRGVRFSSHSQVQGVGVEVQSFRGRVLGFRFRDSGFGFRCPASNVTYGGAVSFGLQGNSIFWVSGFGI